MIHINESDEVAFAEYKKSVEALLAVTKFYSGGSRAAAQVLLSAYNGNCFQVDIPDLGVLDRKNLGHALRVIWGRSMMPWQEPHKVVENGEAIFKQLWEDWPGLTVNARCKKNCEYCSDCD